MKRLSEEWIAKAEEDYEVALELARSTRLTPYNVICFHCQQAGQKWLKTRLCENGVEFPKTHDLRQLLHLLGSSHPEWMSLVEAARRLSFFSTDTRYPGDSANQEDAEQAIADMCQIRDAIRASFGL